MAYFEADIKNRYSVLSLYETYTSSIKGIHYDNTDGIQLVYIIRGSLKIRDSGNFKTYKEGDILLLNCEELKFLYSLSKKSQILIFNLAYEYLSSQPGYDQKKVYRLEASSCKRKELKELILSSHSLASQAGPVEEIARNMDRMLTILNSSCLRLMDKKAYSRDQWSYMQKIKAYVSKGDVRYFNLQELAKEIFISPSYCSSIFKDISGQGFSEFIQQYSLYRASRELIYSSKNIEEVSSLVGFKSSKSLNLIFNKYLGLSPSRFRKNYRGWEEEYLELPQLELGLDGPSYENLYRSQGLSSHQLNYKDPGLGLKAISRVIRLESLGKNYRENLELILRGMRLDELIINIEIGDRVRLRGLDGDFRLKNFLEFMDIVISNSIVLVFKISLEALDFTGADLDHQMDKNIDRLEKFYRYLADIAGISNMKSFKYFIDLSQLEQIKKDGLLEKYRTYIKRQIKALERTMGCSNYDLGYDLASLSNSKLDIFLRLYKDWGEENPSLAFSLEAKFKKDITSIEEASQGLGYIEEILLGLSRSLEFFNLSFKNIYIRDILKNLDLSKVPDEYKDLLMVVLEYRLLENRNLRQKFILEKSFYDREAQDQSYQLRLVNKYGFFSLSYWAYHLIDQLEGEIIYRGRNLLISRKDGDLDLLLMGDGLIDSSFAASRKFKNLDRVNNQIEIKIGDMAGRYKLSQLLVEYSGSSAEYYLKGYENYKYLTYDEINSIKKLSSPRLSIDFFQIEEGLKISLGHGPFSLVLQKYRKIL